MALKTLGALGVLLFAYGCKDTTAKCDTADSGGCDSGDADTDTDTDTDADADSFAATWNADGVSVDVTNDGGGFSFGFAEESDNGWYGEDCVDGPGPNSGSTDICHGSATSGLSLETVDAIGDVVEDSTTLLNVTIAEAGHLAYVMINTSGTGCLTENDSTGYYASFGCGTN